MSFPRPCVTWSETNSTGNTSVQSPAANHISLISLWVWRFSRSLISVFSNGYKSHTASLNTPMKPVNRRSVKRFKITALRRNFAPFTFDFAPNGGILPAQLSMPQTFATTSLNITYGYNFTAVWIEQGIFSQANVWGLESNKIQIYFLLFSWKYCIK